MIQASPSKPLEIDHFADFWITTGIATKRIGLKEEFLKNKFQVSGRNSFDRCFFLNQIVKLALTQDQIEQLAGILTQASEPMSRPVIAGQILRSSPDQGGQLELHISLIDRKIAEAMRTAFVKATEKREAKARKSQS